VITLSVYGLDSRDSIPGRSKIFLFSVVFRMALGPTQPNTQWTLGVKRPGSETNHSQQSSANVNNAEAVTLHPHRDSFTLIDIYC
jgi:hypothetical protein